MSTPFTSPIYPDRPKTARMASGLGRSKHLTMQLPKQCQQADSAVSKLLEEYLNVVPSFKILTEASEGWREERLKLDNCGYPGNIIATEYGLQFWLVLWNIFYFPAYWKYNHLN